MEPTPFPICSSGPLLVFDPRRNEIKPWKSDQKRTGLSHDPAEPAFSVLALTHETLWAAFLQEASPKAGSRFYGLGLGAGFFAGALVPVPAPSAFRLSSARASCVLNG